MAHGGGAATAWAHGKGLYHICTSYIMDTQTDLPRHRDLWNNGRRRASAQRATREDNAKKRYRAQAMTYRKSVLN